MPLALIVFSRVFPAASMPVRQSEWRCSSVSSLAAKPAEKVDLVTARHAAVRVVADHPVVVIEGRSDVREDLAVAPLLQTACSGRG
jgi:hypothetical protein